MFPCQRATGFGPGASPTLDLALPFLLSLSGGSVFSVPGVPCHSSLEGSPQGAVAVGGLSVSVTPSSSGGQRHCWMICVSLRHKLLYMG